MSKCRRITLAAPVAFVMPLPVSADAGWPTLLIAVSPVIAWYIGIISILAEAGVLWYWLRPTVGQALLMSIVANLASLIVGVMLGGLGVGYVSLALSWRVSWSFMMLLTIIVEFNVIRAIWPYHWRQLWLPVVAMNVLTYLVIAAQLLKDNPIW